MTRLLSILVLLCSHSAWADIKASAWVIKADLKHHDVPVYMVLTNLSQTADKLIRAETPIAPSVIMRQNIQNNIGVVRTEKVRSIPLPALAMQQIHADTHQLWLTDVRLKNGNPATFPMFLTFSNAPPQRIDVQILDAANAINK